MTTGFDYEQFSLELLEHEINNIHYDIAKLEYRESLIQAAIEQKTISALIEAAAGR